MSDYEISDEVLIKQFQDGDVRSFNQIVFRYKDRLIHFIHGFVHDIDKAEDLVQDTFINLTIYDLTGNQVKTLVNGKERSGNRFIQWDATNHQGHPVPSGTYLYKIEADNFNKTKKMVLLK